MESFVPLFMKSGTKSAAEEERRFLGEGISWGDIFYESSLAGWLHCRLLCPDANGSRGTI